MKTCDQYQELVSAYVDGEAKDEETSDMFFHLGACRECRTFLTSVLDLQWVLLNEGAAQRHRTDESHFAARPIAQSAPMQRVPVWRRRFSISYSAAAVLVALMLMSAALFVNQFPRQMPPVSRTQTEYVYLTSYPAVDVVASPLPPLQSY